MMCNNCWPNNDGGMWCWKHCNGVDNRDCKECEHRVKPNPNPRYTRYLTSIKVKEVKI